MKKLEISIQNIPANIPVKISILVDQDKYSEVKLYVTKDADGKPVIVPKKWWYIYYYFRSPITGLMQKQMDTCKINRIKDVKERLRVGKAWVKAYEILLSQGFDPFQPKGIKPKPFEPDYFSVRSGLQYAYDNKVGEWKQATADDYRGRMNLFLDWAKDNRVDNIDLQQLSELHMIAFMNWLIKPKNKGGRGVGMTSQDNYKRCLSGLFGKLVADKIIKINPIAEVKTKTGEPVKNTPFTGQQAQELRDYMLEHDPQLYRFIQFVIYVFLRPREIVRLTVDDIKIRERSLSVETKNKRKMLKRLVCPVMDYLENLPLDSRPAQAHLFTPSGEIELWDAPLKSKVDHFGVRFRKVKQHFGYGVEYGIYSFRHTAALDLYHSFIKRDGLGHREAVLRLMPIIGHDNEETTERYLRDIGAMLPKDYGEFYTVDF